MIKLFLLASLVFTSLLQAKEYKVIYNCSSSDSNFIKSRMWLIGKTMDMVKEQSDANNVVLTLHGGCMAMVSKDYDMLVAKEDVQNIKQAQEYLKNLSKRDVKIIACDMALKGSSIDRKDVLPFIEVSPNSFLETIEYQNKGYALMPLK